ncbi:MAG: HEAT repeat domain-containing protein [Gemmataceae bacterium]
MRYSPIVTVALALLAAAPLAGQTSPTKKEPRYKGKTISYWVQELQSEQDARRLEAKHALRAFGPRAETAVPALKLMLEDLSPEFRHFALVTLSEIGPLAKKAVPELVEVLKEEKNGELRKLAADTLGKIGPDAAPALPALRDLVGGHEHPKDRAAYMEREHLLVVMTQIGEKAALPLAELLDKEDADFRQTVLLAFEVLGPKAKQAVEKLEPLLKDSNPWVRFVAARALWKIAEHKECVPTYAKLLDDQDLTLRTEVAWTLGKMGADAHEALPALQKQLEVVEKQAIDPRLDRFRATALNAVFRIDPQARMQEPPLHNDSVDKNKAKQAEKPVQGKAEPQEPPAQKVPVKIPELPPPVPETKPEEPKPMTAPGQPAELPMMPPEEKREDKPAEPSAARDREGVFQFWLSFFH